MDFNKKEINILLSAVLSKIEERKSYATVRHKLAASGLVNISDTKINDVLDIFLERAEEDIALLEGISEKILATYSESAHSENEIAEWKWSEENECWVCPKCGLSALNDYKGNSTESEFCPHCGIPLKQGRIEEKSDDTAESLAQKLVDKYNAMLRERYGQNITVEIKFYVEDDDSIWYYYTSAKYGDSDAYETAEVAYENADDFLDGVGEIY